MKEDDFTGSMGSVMGIDRTLKEVPIAEVKVDTSYYTGVTQAICLRDPLFDLVIGNIPGAQNPDDPVPGGETCAAAVTRAQARKDITVKPLVTKETAQTSITKNELAKLQQEDNTLEKYVDLKNAVRKGDYKIKYEKHRGVLYRIRNRVNGLGECSLLKADYGVKNIEEKGYGGRPRFDFWRTSWDQKDQRLHSNKFLLAWHAR